MKKYRERGEEWPTRTLGTLSARAPELVEVYVTKNSLFRSSPSLDAFVEIPCQLEFVGYS